MSVSCKLSTGGMGRENRKFYARLSEMIFVIAFIANIFVSRH